MTEVTVVDEHAYKGISPNSIERVGLVTRKRGV